MRRPNGNQEKKTTMTCKNKKIHCQKPEFKSYTRKEYDKKQRGKNRQNKTGF